MVRSKEGPWQYVHISGGSFEGQSRKMKFAFRCVKKSSTPSKHDQ